MPSRFQGIVKKTDLVQEVVDRIRALISSGELSEGEELPSEGVLAESFGVSRTVTREAIRTLRGQGLINGSQGRRPRVQQPNTDSTIDTLHFHLNLRRTTLLQQIEVRKAVECTIAELAAQRRSTQHLADLELATADLLAAQTRKQSADADLRFHRILAAATGNSLFETVLGAIGELMRVSMGAKNDDEDRDVMNKVHEEVLAAVSDGNPKASREAMMRHMQEAERILKCRLAADGDE